VTDFPTTPLFDTGVPSSAPDQFKTAASLYQLTFHAEREINDLVAYTTSSSWTLPIDIWSKLAKNVLEDRGIDAARSGCQEHCEHLRTLRSPSARAPARAAR
jgi:hypothetical protein